MAETFTYGSSNYNIALTVAMDNFADTLPALFAKLGGYEHTGNTNLNTFLANLNDVIPNSNIAYALELHDQIKNAVKDSATYENLTAALQADPDTPDSIKIKEWAATLYGQFNPNIDTVEKLNRAATAANAFDPIGHDEITDDGKALLLELQSVVPTVLSACSNFSDRRLDITIKLKTGGYARLTGRLSIPSQCNEDLIVKNINKIDLTAGEHTKLEELGDAYYALPSILALAACIITQTSGSIADFVKSTPKGNVVNKSDIEYLLTIRYAYPNQHFLETALSLIIYHYLQAVDSITSLGTTMTAKSGPFTVEFIDIYPDLASKLVAHAISDTHVLLDRDLLDM